jgi:hypothetical protein
MQDFAGVHYAAVVAQVAIKPLRPRPRSLLRPIWLKERKQRRIETFLRLAFQSLRYQSQMNEFRMDRNFSPVFCSHFQALVLASVEESPIFVGHLLQVAHVELRDLLKARTSEQ